jgi:catechol 2,3-dioxygenase-like lactoylglutathione lyase family enzyme
MSRMVHLVSLVWNATSPTELGRFWEQSLRWHARRLDGDVVELVPGDATSFRVRFRPGAGSKVGQNRIHLDLTTTSHADQHATVAELLSMGATHIDIGQSPDETHVVLADPEGNELCVLEPGNRFLAGCPRLGAVNCDGTHALGCFWSEALGWPLVWDEGEETAIQAPDGTGPKITWSGPPLMPRLGEERVHLHVAPAAGRGVVDARAHLLSLGASVLDRGHGCRGAMALADVDGNAFCLVEQ